MMNHHSWRTPKAGFAGALFLGNALVTVASAQSGPLFKVNDSVLAKHIGSGAQFALYDTAKGPECIGVFDAAAANQGKEPMQPAGLKNAAEMQAILDAAPKMNGNPMILKGPYTGPPVPTADCKIGEATSNYAAPAQKTAGPVQDPQNVVAAEMAGLSNSVKLQYKILKADAKQALIQVTDSNNQQHMMKIESDASGVTAFRDSFKTSTATDSHDGNFKSWGGHSIRLAIDNGNARYYSPDGTPQVAKENKFAGESTSRIMQFWDKSTFADMADKIKALLGSDPAYNVVLYAIAGKPVAATPEANGASPH